MWTIGSLNLNDDYLGNKFYIEISISFWMSMKSENFMRHIFQFWLPGERGENMNTSTKTPISIYSEIVLDIWSLPVIMYIITP